jgi:hypothetical protein
VKNHLQSRVNEWLEEKTLRFPLTINETEFALRFIPELRPATDLAKEICLQYANISGTNVLLEGDDNCIKPISQFIQNKINLFYNEKTLEFPLTVKNSTFNIRLLPERHNPVDTARQLCVQNAVQFELTEENIVNTCIIPIKNVIEKQIQIWLNSKILEFTFHVNKKPYSISFLPERVQSQEVATKFCYQHANDFQLSKENFIEKCVTPVNEFITNSINQWIGEKKLTVPLQLGEKKMDVVFIPEREHTLYVARNVCLQNVDTLSLTNENFMSECVAPVQNLLKESLNKWLNEKRANDKAPLEVTP